MTRRSSWEQAFAIVRRDHLPGHAHDPDASNPPLICGGEYSYAVKEVVLSADAAMREVERLNAACSGDDVRYFWTGTHLFTDGGSHGETPSD